MIDIQVITTTICLGGELLAVEMRQQENAWQESAYLLPTDGIQEVAVSKMMRWK